MARCWICNAYVERPVFQCKVCGISDEIKKLRRSKINNFRELVVVQRRWVEKSSEVSPYIGSVIEWGFMGIIWKLFLQTEVLKNIDTTLKKSEHIQANDWRQIAENFKEREIFNKSKEFFIMSLDTNPFDFRTYIGLAETYLHIDMFDKAKKILEESIPFAPKLPLNLKLIKSKESKKLHPVSVKTVEDVDKYLLWLEEEYEVKSEINFEEEEVDRGDTFFPANFRSYSYRLIAHIYACNEKYPEAISVLQNAVKLSPNYYIAYYDMAKYQAQIRAPEASISALKKAIEGYPFFFDMAEIEEDFNPISHDINNFLNEISNEAYDNAKTAISEAEKKLQSTEKSVNKAQKALKDCSNGPLCGIETLKNSKEMLNLAKNRIELKDYKAYLKAKMIAKDAHNFFNRAKDRTDQRYKHYIDTYSKRRTRAIKKIPFLALLTLAFISGFFIIFGVIGFIIGAGFHNWEGGLKVGGISGTFLGLIFGVIFSIHSFLEKLREYIE